MKRILAYIVLVSFCMFAGGCGKKTEPAAEPMEIAEKIHMEAMSLYEGGDIDRAIGNLESGLGDNSLDDGAKGYLFRTLVDLQLDMNQAEKAETAVLKAIQENAGYAVSHFGSIMEYYRRHGNTDALAEWCINLLDADLPEKYRQQAMASLLGAHTSQGDIDKALDVLSKHIGEFSETVRDQLVKNFLYSRINSNSFDDAEKILDTVGKLFPESNSLKVMDTVAHIDILFLKKKWKEAIAMLEDKAFDMDDGDLNQVLRRALNRLKNNGKEDMLNELCRHILERLEAMPASKNTAAQAYLETAGGDPKEIADRLIFIEYFDMDVANLFRIWEKYFYTVMSSNNREIMKNMSLFGSRLAMQMKGSRHEQHLQLLMLDAAFLMEDYEKALGLIGNMSGQEETWRLSATAKIKAHLAMQQDRKEDAVKYFREFMDIIKGEAQAEKDPTTGIFHTREMILGRNAMRIGDIYASINKPDEARKAYKEAREYYATALADTQAKKYTEAEALVKKEAEGVEQAIRALPSSGN